MTAADVTMEKTRKCSVCNKRMHHGYRAVAISNDKGKIKAYVCSDSCSRQQIGLLKYAGR